MARKIVYPTPEKVIEYNTLALSILKVKRADKPEVLSYSRIVEAIDACKETKGDLYDKAVSLLKGLIQRHPFASGNRRTAFIVAKDFLSSNGEKFKIKDDPKYATVMQGMRENYYSDEEIKEWMKNGKIREFRR